MRQRGVAYRRGLYVATRVARRRDAVLLGVLLVVCWSTLLALGWAAGWAVSR